MQGQLSDARSSATAMLFEKCPESSERVHEPRWLKGKRAVDNRPYISVRSIERPESPSWSNFCRNPPCIFPAFLVEYMFDKPTGGPRRKERNL